MSNALFSKLWPIDVSFFPGEQPTATKLNGMIGQLSSALFMLESFLGNGTDYDITDIKDRKMLFNLSNAIGGTDKLYKPINKLTSLLYISRLFARDNIAPLATYDPATDILSVTTMIKPITLPVNIFPGDELGIYYNGAGTITNFDGAGGIVELPDNGAQYGWYKIITGSNADFISLIRTGGLFNIKSFYITSKLQDSTTGQDVAFNKSYGVPISNANYYMLKTPCKYSNPTADIKCASKTCNYCIGNTYEYDQTITIGGSPYGTPKCLSAVSETAEPISYSSETMLSSPQRAAYLTVQSPLVTVSNQYGIKYAPISINDEIIDVEIPQNQCIIYDTKNSASTIKYTTALFSAGRADILYIKDTSIFQEGLTDYKRYMVLGAYGITDLMYDLMPFINLSLPMDSFPITVATYADDNGN